MLNILDFSLNCENIGILRIIVLIKKFLELAKFAVPIILIIMCMIDAVKNTISSGGWDKKIVKKIVMKMIAAVVFFIVPAILNIVLNLLGEQNYNQGTCWTNATDEYINSHKNVDDKTRDDNTSANEKIMAALEERLKVWEIKR